MTDSASAENRIRLMSLPSRFSFAAIHAAWLSAGLAVAVIAPRALARVASLPASHGPSETSTRASVDPGHPLRFAGLDWTVFKDDSQSAPAETGSLGRRFRLVGTFLAYSGRVTDGDVVRKAVLDDRTNILQRIVAEGETFEAVTVARVMRDKVTLRQGGREETLTLRFESAASDSGASGGADGGAQSGPSGASPVAGAAAPGQDRFGGRQVGENKWRFDRRPLLDYYAELRDNPERLVKLFDSFKPVYDARRRVSGYKIKYEGESEFLKSVGLKEGDVVRTVNSMRMTSQRRAEFFIKEFIDNRSNAFVMDVERNGQPTTMTYEAR